MAAGETAFKRERMMETKEKKDETTTALVQAGQERATWAMGGDQVMQATGRMDERQRELLRWFFYYCIENGITMKAAAEAIRYDSTTVYRVMRGQYEGNLDAVCDAVEGYKKIVEQRAGLAKTAFVETETARRIWKICDAARAHQSIAMIFGDSQLGKTFALTEYTRRNNHGATRYVRLPAAAGIQMACKVFAEACGLSHKCSCEAMRERVLNALDENTLLIVDELHLTFNTYGTRPCIATLEMIREIHDRTQCGMVLCGTNVARKEIEAGQHKLLLEQLRRRSFFRLNLPAIPYKKDLLAIAAAYHLDAPAGDAEKMVDEIIHASGLKAYVSYLRAGTKLAARRKQTFAWSHVSDAYETIQNYSRFG